MTARMLRLLVAFAVVNVLLLAPGWLATEGALAPWIALEAVLVVGLVALLPRRRWSLVLAGATAVALVSLTVVALGDAAARLALGRSLNLYLDLYLLGAVHDLVAGAVGPVGAAALLVGAAAGLVLAGSGLACLLAAVRTDAGDRLPRVAGAGLVGLVGLVTVGLGAVVPAAREGEPSADRFASPAVDLVAEQARQTARMLDERERFGAELAAAPRSPATGAAALGRLEGRDVILAFVESYGMTSLNDDRYAAVVRPRLREMGIRLSEAGLHLATGSLVAPTRGGQSWFSHGSLLSGLWLDNQLRYDLLVASDRPTLIDDFRDAGHRTVAVMPAITRAWPEGERFGYDRIYAHGEIGYRGPALNWVTMPDQFTWWFLESEVRRSDDPRPLFAEVGLISSHAPWTPILPVLEDWEGMGDGSVFGPWQDAGERPEELWRDPDRVRDHFARSVDYAVHAATAYAERFVDDRTLLIVLGDHQPAPLITGEGAGGAVPVHVISGDSTLVEPFLAWGFRRGARPDPAHDPPGMDAFREWFLDAYSGRAGATQ